ncbi:MAG: glycosyltransferase [Chloroflexota bacterium]
MLADVYRPHISGITNYIAVNKKYLEAAGHQVYVFTFGDLDHQDEDNIIRSPGLPLIDTGYYLSFSYSRKAKALAQTMDIVHVHHPFLTGRLALRYCHPLRIPIVFTNHTRYDLYAQAYLPILPEEFSDTFLQKYMPPFCDAVDLVVAPSAGMERILRHLGVTSNIIIIPNGVELHRFRENSKSPTRAELGFTSDDIILIYTGRLGPEKNIDFLIRAFSGVSDAVANANLVIIGSGPEMDNLRAVANQTGLSRKIHFLGFINYDQLPAYLKIGDIFVTASVTEVHPLSVIEAMASGLPVMGVQSVGVGDTVDHGITGFLSREDPAAFSALLTRLCLDTDLRKNMSRNAAGSVNKYSIEGTTSKMLSIYEELVKGASTRRRGVGYQVRQLMEKLRG